MMRHFIRVHTLVDEKIPVVFQSNFGIFQALSVIVHRRFPGFSGEWEPFFIYDNTSAATND